MPCRPYSALVLANILVIFIDLRIRPGSPIVLSALLPHTKSTEISESPSNRSNRPNLQLQSVRITSMRRKKLDTMSFSAVSSRFRPSWVSQPDGLLVPSDHQESLRSPHPSTAPAILSNLIMKESRGDDKMIISSLSDLSRKLSTALPFVSLLTY